MSKDNKIDVEELNVDETGLTEEQMMAVVEAGETMIEAANSVVDQIGGSDNDVIQLLAMALGLHTGRMGMGRGLMLDYLLDWYDQGVVEGMEMEEGEPIIEVELESDKKGSN